MAPRWTARAVASMALDVCKALLPYALVLGCLIAVGPPVATKVLEVFQDSDLETQAGLLVAAGCGLVIVKAALAIARPSGRGLADAPMVTAVNVTSAIDVSAEYRPAVQTMVARYGYPYTQWVVAHLTGQEAVEDILTIARERHPVWADARANSAMSGSDLAHHEARHAVVAHALGMTVTKVTLVPTETSGGHTSVQGAVPLGSTATQLFTMMSVFYAGCRDDHVDAVGDQSSDVDTIQLISSATRIVASQGRPDGFEGPLTSDALLAAAAARSKMILAQNRDVVEQISSALMTNRTITGEPLRWFLAGVRR